MSLSRFLAIPLPRVPRLNRVYSRGLASPAETSGVEPPDYLSEGELRIFQKLKAELSPIKLEVAPYPRLS